MNLDSDKAREGASPAERRGDNRWRVVSNHHTAQKGFLASSPHPYALARARHPRISRNHPESPESRVGAGYFACDLG